MRRDSVSTQYLSAANDQMQPKVANWPLQWFYEDYDMLCVINLYISRGNFSLRMSPNDRSLRNFFMKILFLSQSFWHNLLRGCRQRKFFFIFPFDREVWPGVWTVASRLISQDTIYQTTARYAYGYMQSNIFVKPDQSLFKESQSNYNGALDESTAHRLRQNLQEQKDETTKHHLCHCHCVTECLYIANLNL